MPEGPKLIYCADALRCFGYKAQNAFLDDCLFRYYEEVGTRVKYMKIKPGDIFLDVGACVGSWSVPAALLGAQVFAFEVGGPQISALLLNMGFNNIKKDQIKIDHVALCESDNKKLMFNGLMNVGHEGIPIESTTLDTWVNERRDELPHIDYIKIDVEGMELDVLHGAQQTLREFKPKLMVEIHERIGDTLRSDIEYLLTQDLDYKHEHIYPFHDYFY